MKAEEVLRELNELVATAEIEGLCALAAALTAAASHAAARCLDMHARTRPKPEPKEDRLLTAKAAAAITAVSTRFLYTRAHELPFAKRLGDKAVRFSEKGLRLWIEERRA